MQLSVGVDFSYTEEEKKKAFILFFHFQQIWENVFLLTSTFKQKNLYISSLDFLNSGKCKTVRNIWEH